MKCYDCRGVGTYANSSPTACATCKGSGLARLTATDVAAYLLHLADIDTLRDVVRESLRASAAMVMRGELDDPDLVRRVMGMKR
jgi:hypothetical protein